MPKIFSRKFINKKKIQIGNCAKKIEMTQKKANKVSKNLKCYTYLQQSIYMANLFDNLLKKKLNMQNNAFTFSL